MVVCYKVKFFVVAKMVVVQSIIIVAINHVALVVAAFLLVLAAAAILHITWYYSVHYSFINILYWLGYCCRYYLHKYFSWFLRPVNRVTLIRDRIHFSIQLGLPIIRENKSKPSDHWINNLLFRPILARQFASLIQQIQVNA